MTFAEAQRLIAAHFKHHKVQQPGLGPEGVADALVAGEQLHFEFVPATGTLRASAFIYRWREWPVPGLLEALQQEAKSGRGETGGGSLEYVSERKTLSLVRDEVSCPPESEFEQAQTALRQACTQWRGDVFARVAERVRHPAG